MECFGALLLALAVLIAISVFQGRRRVRALESFARQHGWSFTAGDVAGLTEAFEPAYGLFQEGHSRMASDVLERHVRGRRVEVFGYRYVIGMGKRRHVFHQTVAHISDPALRLPWFSLRPAHAVRQMFGTQGFGNVFIHAAPEFSMQNYVAGMDPEATARRFTPAVMGAVGSLQRIAMDGGGEHLFLYRHNRIEKVADLESFAARSVAIADAFAAGAGVAPPAL